MPTFKELNLLPEIQRALDDLEFSTPTEIQKKAIPLLLASKKIDFHGQAQTGTGKTIAFTIPLLHRIDIQKRYPQSLIIVPTRELAIQIYDSIKLTSKYLGVKTALIYGGVSMEEQIRNLKGGVHIVVGTPGRIKDHLQRKTLSLKETSTLVLDEADIMLDMGFKEEIDAILNYMPKDREIWLFSATIKSGIEDIKKSHMTDPVAVRVSVKNVGTEKTEQYYCIIPFKARLHAVTRFIQSSPGFYGIIFCQTKILASEVADELTKRGYNVGALHGDMSQAHRNMVIKKFKQGDFSVLVATDVAARGIDVANLTHVINFSIPEDLESYVHRIGRTGRAGKKGTAITFVNKTELRSLQQIEHKFTVKISPIDVPSKQVLINTALQEVEQYIKDLPIEKVDLDPINKLLETLNPENLRTITSNLLYNKFLAKLDLEDIPHTPVNVNYNNDSDQDQEQEIFINLGADDDITQDDVKDYLSQAGIQEDQVRKIRVIKRRTYIKLAADCSPELFMALRKKPLKGRLVRVNLTCHVEGSPSSSYGSRSGRRDGGSGRSSGGNFRRRPSGRDDSRGSRSSQDRRK